MKFYNIMGILWALMAIWDVIDQSPTSYVAAMVMSLALSGLCFRVSELERKISEPHIN